MSEPTPYQKKICPECLGTKRTFDNQVWCGACNGTGYLNEGGEQKSSSEPSISMGRALQHKPMSWVKWSSEHPRWIIPSEAYYSIQAEARKGLVEELRKEKVISESLSTLIEQMGQTAKSRDEEIAKLRRQIEKWSEQESGTMRSIMSEGMGG